MKGWGGNDRRRGSGNSDWLVKWENIVCFFILKEQARYVGINLNIMRKFGIIVECHNNKGRLDFWVYDHGPIWIIIIAPNIIFLTVEQPSNQIPIFPIVPLWHLCPHIFLYHCHFLKKMQFLTEMWILFLISCIYREM